MPWKYWASTDKAYEYFLIDSKNLSDVSRLFCYSFILGFILKGSSGNSIKINFFEISYLLLNILTFFVILFIIIDFIQYISSFIGSYILRSECNKYHIYENDESGNIQEYSESKDKSEKIFEFKGRALYYHNDLPIKLYKIKFVIMTIILLIIIFSFICSLISSFKCS
ncbi:MAG: hypothetical protein K2X69_14605 [Silvanigrellaceae bacterium]|nr:hypothetical protein [Silvanigrellaceae bacterium]